MNTVQPLRDGDFITLMFKEVKPTKQEQGYIGVKSLYDQHQDGDEDQFQVFRRQEEEPLNFFDGKNPTESMNIFSPFLIRVGAQAFPPNFQTSCVFQIDTETSNARGQIIRYGTAIRLKHRGTQRFLTASMDIANESIGMFEISLKKKSTQASYFKIFPSLKMRQQGEIVFLDDTIELQSRATLHFLNFSKKNNYHLVGKSASRPWKIKAFSRSDEQQEQDQTAIRAGDFCRLFHRESEGFIRANFNDLHFRKVATSQKPAIVDIFDEFLPRNQPEKLYSIHLALSSMLRKSKQNHSTLNIFQIELERQDDGGLILWKRPVRFKHIATGMYLQYKPQVDDEGMTKDQLSLGRDFTDPATLFNLIPIAVDNIKPYASFNSFARIRHGESGLFLNVATGLRKVDLEALALEDHQSEGEVSDTDNVTGKGTSVKATSVKPAQTSLLEQKEGGAKGELKEQRYWEKKREIRLIDFALDQDVFKLHPVVDDDVLDLQTIQGNRKVLLSFLRQLLKQRHLMKMKPAIVEQVVHTIITLTMEMTSLSKSSFSDQYDELAEMINNSQTKKIKQKIMVEQYMVEIILRILYELWHRYFKRNYQPRTPQWVVDKYKSEKKTRIGAALNDTAKFSHLLLKVLVKHNKSALKRIYELEVMGFLLDQITASWDICYHEIFGAVSQDINMPLDILEKEGIKSLADKLYTQISAQNYNNKILELLTYLCAPGGKPDRRIQDNVLEIIIGYETIPESFGQYDVQGFDGWNVSESCFVMPLERIHGQFLIYPNTLRKPRPPYFRVPERGKVVTVQKSKASIHQLQRKRVMISEFFSISEETAILLGLKGVKQLKNRVKYFRSLMKLYVALCTSQFKEGQKSVQNLMPPELLLHVLQDSRVPTDEKKIFMELLITLYLRYYRLPPVPSNLMPEVLQLDNQPHETALVQKESEKLFVMNAVDLQVAEKRHHRSRIGSQNVEDLEQPGTEVEDTQTLKMKEDLGGLLLLGQNKKGEDEMEDFHSQQLELSKKRQSIMKPLVWERVLKLRADLHNYMVQTLRACDLSWESDLQTISFFNSFFKLLQELMVRQFFHPDYDHFFKSNILKQMPSFNVAVFERQLVDPSPIGTHGHKLIQFLPDYVQQSLTSRKRRKGDDIEYQHFYILLKFALNKQLRRLRPYYFTVNNVAEDALENRLQCRNPRSVLISEVKLHVSSVLQLIYDYYQSAVLHEYWELCKGIINAIIADDRNRKLFRIKHRNKEKSFHSLNESEAPVNREPDEEPNEEDENANSTDKFNKFFQPLNRSLQEIPYRGMLGDTMPRSATKVNVSHADYEIEFAERRENALMEAHDEDDLEANAQFIYQHLAKKVGSRYVKDEMPSTPSKRSQVAPRGSILTQSDFDSKRGGDADGINIVVFEPVTAAKLKRFNKSIKKFANSFVNGQFTHHALGKYQALQDDPLMDYAIDMLHYKNSLLTISAMNLMYRHFNVFASTRFGISRCLLVNGEEELQTYQHIRVQTHKFKARTQSLQLPINSKSLLRILKCFQNKGDAIFDPGLSEITYATLWSARCKYCKRWYRCPKNRPAGSSMNPLDQLQDIHQQDEMKHGSSRKAWQCEQEHKNAYFGEANAQKMELLGVKVKHVERYIPGARNIVAKNQELLRKVETHQEVVTFLKKKLQKNKEYSQLQQSVFKECYRFLYYFILRHESNIAELTQRKYVRMFLSHLELPFLRFEIIKLLTELVEDNEEAANMVKPEHVIQIVQYMTECPVDDHIMIDYIQFLKMLIETDIGVNKDRQKTIVHHISLKFSRSYIADQTRLNYLLMNKNNPLDQLVSLRQSIAQEIPKAQGHNQSDSVKSVTQQAERLIADSAKVRETGEAKRQKSKKELQLKIHLQFVDLLGLCAKERNYIAERFCRENIPIEVASSVMMKNELGVEIIVPYLRYMHGVFFTTEELKKKKKKGITKETELEVMINNQPGAFLGIFINIIGPAFGKINQIYMLKKQIILGGNEQTEEQQNEEDYYNYIIIDVIIPFLQDLIADGHLEEICRIYAARSPSSKPYKVGTIDSEEYAPKPKSLFARASGLMDQLKEKIEQEVKERKPQIKILKDDGQEVQKDEDEQEEEQDDDVTGPTMAINEDDEEEEEGDQMLCAETEAMVKIVRDIVDVLRMMTKNELVVNNENRRVVFIDFMEICTSNNNLGSIKMLDEARIIKLQKLIQLLKLRDQQTMEEDIELQNRKLLERFIQQSAMPQIYSALAIQIMNLTLNRNNEEERQKRAELEILARQQAKLVLPEFISFINFFRTRLYSFRLHMLKKPIIEDNFWDILRPSFYHISNPKTLIGPDLSPPQYKKEFTLKNVHNKAIKLSLDPQFAEITERGGVLFKNIIRILKDPSITAHKDTDTGFLQLLQAILILQGASLRIKADLSETPFRFQRRWIDDIPERLELIQWTFGNFMADEMVVNIISLANQYLRPGMQKSEYFRVLLLEALKVGSCMLSYGNRTLQSSMIQEFKEAIISNKSGQYFLFGLRRIFELGKTRSLMKPPAQSAELVALGSSSVDGSTGRGQADLTHALIQNAALFVQNLCQNHNFDVKNFLRVQDEALANVDMISAIAVTTMKMCEQLNNNVTYLDDESAPALLRTLGRTFVSDKTKQPKLIDWFKTSGMPEKKAWITFIQLIRTLTEMVQGPVPDNQESLTQARVSSSLMQVLEFFSCVFFKGKIKRIRREFSGDSKAELVAATERLSIHPEVRIEVAHINRKALLRQRGRTLPDMKTGQEKKKILELLLLTEANILTFLRGLIEGRNMVKSKGGDKNAFDVSTSLVSSLDVDVLLESMNNHYHKTVSLDPRLAAAQQRNLFMYYAFMTALVEIENMESDAGRIFAKKFIHWKGSAKGVERLMGRIEILNTDKELEVIYFQIPDIVRKYWGDHFVNQFRENLITQVKRDNPEQKVKDFFEKSENLIYAVEHQDRIARIRKSCCCGGPLLYNFANYRNLWFYSYYVLSLALNIMLIATFKEDANKDLTFYESPDVEFYLQLVLGSLLILLSMIILAYEFINWTLLNAYVTYDSFNYSDYSRKGASSSDDELAAMGTESKPTRCYICCQVTRTVLFNINLIFSFIMLGAAIAGTAWHPGLFTFTLAVFIKENRLLRYVLKSAIDNWDQMIITVIFGIIVLYWYTAATFFSTWRGKYNFEGEMDCTSLINCFRIHLDYGFMAFPVWSGVSPNAAAGYNFTYMVIVNLIITSIISGIIIDTFSALRTQSQEVSDDTKNRCFICNIDREEFDRMNIDFETHIKQFHNMWHYVWFFMYLERKNRDDFTGQEEYIWSMYNNSNIGFFPIKRALQMHGSHTRKKDISALFDLIGSEFKNLSKRMARLEEKVDEIQLQN